MEQILINEALHMLGNARSRGRESFIIPYTPRTALLFSREEYIALLDTQSERTGWIIYDDGQTITATDYTL